MPGSDPDGDFLANTLVISMGRVQKSILAAVTLDGSVVVSIPCYYVARRIAESNADTNRR